MRQWNRQVVRFLMVLALGASLTGLAAQVPRSEKPGLRAEKARPEPILLATATESQLPDPLLSESALPEQCLLTPRDEESAASTTGESRSKTAESHDGGARAKKKVIACG